MIILDTHIWLWWINDDGYRLNSKKLKLISEADTVAISAISCFEVAWLVRHNRIDLPCRLDVWFEKALSGSGIELAPISPEIAKIAVDLPEHHSDPQDRLIIATALSHDAQLMSIDKKFSKYTEITGRLI